MKEKQRRICEAVLEMIASGVPESDMTVAEIAKKASIGKGTVYEYFPSKREIFLGTAEYFKEQTLSDLRRNCQGMSFREACFGFLRCVFRCLKKGEPLFSFLFLGRYMDPLAMKNSGSAENCPFYLDGTKAVFEIGKEIVEQGQREGILRENILPHEQLFAYVSAVSVLRAAENKKNEVFLQRTFTEQELYVCAYEVFVQVLQVPLTGQDVP